MPTLDVFNNNAFGLISLTNQVNRIPHQPRQLEVLGIFNDRPIETTSFFIDVENGRLVLVPQSPRGGVGTPFNLDRSQSKSFSVGHIQMDGNVTSDEIQDVRVLGTETELQSVTRKVNDKMTPMVSSIEATIEWQRINAIKGQVLDADGTVLVNLFTEFGVTQSPVVNIDFNDPADAAQQAALQQIDVMQTQMRDAMQNEIFMGFHAFCGRDFISKLTSSAVYRNSVEREMNQFLLQRLIQIPGQATKRVLFQDIIWEEYRGQMEVAGAPTTFVETNTAHIVPIGTNLFEVYYGPGDFLGAANMNGQPRYARQWRTIDDKAVALEVQSNPLAMCLRPDALQTMVAA